MLAFLPNPLGLVSWIFNGVTSAAANAGKEIFEFFVNITISAVGYLFATVWNWIDGATTPDVMSVWFAGGPYAMVMRLATMVLFSAVMMSIGYAIWNRNIQELQHALMNEFPKAMWNLSTLLLQITIGLAIADAITMWFLSVTGDGATNFAERMINLDQGWDLGFGLVAVQIMAMLMLFGIIIVAVMLFARTGLVYVLACVTALAKAGDVYQPMRGGGGRAARLLWGVIAMKPLIALCFVIGGAALGTTSTGTADALDEPGTTVVATVDPDATDAEAAIAEADGGDLGTVTGDLFAGMAVVALAAFAPFSIMQLFPFDGTEAAVGMGGELSGKASGAAKKGAATVATIGSGGTAAPAMAAADDDSRGGGSGGDNAGAAAMGKAAS